MEALRTPEDRFENLPGYDFAPNYVDDLPGYEGLRVHYLDEGPADAPRTFLCLPGEPTWAYLYRHMIPVFAGTGARVVVPDWLGFGRSDKPVSDDIYTFHFHRDMMRALIARLDLRNVTLVVQDWGGILGLTLPVDDPDRFSRLIVMNTGIPVGESLGDGFQAWKDYVASRPDLDCAALMKRSCPHLSEAEANAYEAPFPDQRYKAGVRRFPQLVMVAPDMDGIETAKRARAFWKSDWAGESFMAIGAQDPVLGVPVMQALRDTINGCPAPMIIEEAGHFVQEWGGPVAEAALRHFGDID
ncbi:haloalkane dehalogenase [Maritimibacter sp. UBA3975]|mgnify:CR=1 FL=1|uniref:haloalkane dehalogenase n=1 Tax=Maritimibacter sp. UBA3975 TaxID=1946833 RepID=UPI000C0A52E4|nr:haloalkane dehalogenase [Maritimibacter sp. UBA3975]MAM61645.1 haloalkane dehalogenase [Maritimibacter sp.]|tara:strand:- start:9416 stop:10315 length:900 start_codon:yes stop_codon:yes gene_type:complete